MTNLFRQVAVFLMGVMLLFINGCIVNDDESGANFPCLEGDGPVETSKFELPSFTGIEIRSDVEVILSQGPAQEVEVKAQTNLLNELLLEVNGPDLEIRTRHCIANGSRPQVFITLPQLSRIVNSSSADVFSDNTFVISNLEATIAGSGDTDIGIIADVVKANISGTGNLQLEGEAATMEVKITGSGDLMGFNLFTLSAAVFSSGSGDVEVTIQEFLEATISGSGDVFYKGDPFLEVRLTGTGKVIDAN